MKVVQIKQIRDEARIPQYGSAGAACFDLCACLDAEITVRVINPGKQDIIGTGLAFAIPLGHVMNITPRSGHAAKARISVTNSPGKIDPDYRGEVAVILRNDGEEPFIIRHGDRIAQAEIVESPRWGFMLVSELDETVRNAGGFGSTGTR